MARGVAGRLQKRFVVLNLKELDARRMQYRSAEAKIAVELSSPLSPNVPTGPQNSPLAKLARKGGRLPRTCGNLMMRLQTIPVTWGEIQGGLWRY